MANYMRETAKKVKNPYMKGATRIADVIAAIQFLGTYKFYKVGFDYWEKRIKSPPKSALDWKIIFIKHPEFSEFQLKGMKM